MDPVTGDDQVIEGAFAYFNGKVFFFSSSKCVNEQLKGDTIEFLFFEQSWKVSDSLELYATLILTLL